MPKVIILDRYKFTQSAASFTWTVTHNLNVNHPVVDVWILENDGTYVNSDAHEVEFTSANQVVISFNTAIVAPKGIALIT